MTTDFLVLTAFVIGFGVFAVNSIGDGVLNLGASIFQTEETPADFSAKFIKVEPND